MCWKSHKYRASKTFLKAAPQMWFPWRNGITLVYEEYRDFLGSSVVKNLPANAGDIRDMGLIPAWGRSPWGGHDNPPQYSCLENPRDGGACWAAIYGVAQSQTWLKWLSSSSSSSSSGVMRALGPIEQEQVVGCSCWGPTVNREMWAFLVQFDFYIPLILLTPCDFKKWGTI